MGVPKLLLFKGERLEKAVGDDILNTDKTATPIIGVINSTLAEVLIETMNKVMSLNLTVHVMTIKSKRAHMLVELLDRLKRLHHLRPFLNNMLLH